jgi:hypothetical protein
VKKLAIDIHDIKWILVMILGALFWMLFFQSCTLSLQNTSTIGGTSTTDDNQTPTDNVSATIPLTNLPGV